MNERLTLNPRIEQLTKQGDIKPFREEFGLSKVHLAGILMCTPAKVTNFEKKEQTDRDLILSIKQFKYLSDFIDRYEQEHKNN